MLTSRFLRVFHKRAGPANHLVQRSAGGNHRVDGIFLLDAEIEKSRFGDFARGTDCGNDFAAGRYALAADAKRVGESGKVRRDERRGDVTLVVEELLPLANHSEIAVIDDGDFHVELFLDDGRQLAHGHLEPAVARDDPDFVARPSEFGADGCGQGKAHRAQPPRGDQGARLIVVVVLRLPHLVLADVGDDDCFAAGFLPEIVDDVRGVEMAAVGQALYVADGGIAFEFVDVSDPLAAVERLEAGQQFFENLARIADERGIHFDVLIDFGAVDFDVNLAGLLRVGAQIAGDAVVEAHAHGDEEIGVLNGVVHPGLAVHAHHAEVQRIACRECAEAEERHGHGEISGADEFLKNAHRARNQDAVAGENDGPLRGVEELDGARELLLVVILAIALEREIGRSILPVELAGGLLRVFGHVHEDRPRAAGGCNDKRFAKRPRDIFGAGNNHIVLRDGHGDAGDVGFLEGVRAEELAADLAGDANNRRGIKHGGGDARDHICCARAGSGHGDADAAARAGVPVGHVRGALLVADEDVVNGGSAQRVVGRQNRPARVAEEVLHAEAHECFAEDFGASHFFHTALAEAADSTVFAGAVIFVTAPRDADETRCAYLAITPVAKRGTGGVHSVRRRRTSSSASSTLSARPGISKTTVSPSRTAAIGPPTAASGATWPAIRPCVAPEKRPSVRSATVSPKPAPTSAAVTASISPMPGPPFGPSYRMTTTSPALIAPCSTAAKAAS